MCIIPASVGMAFIPFFLQVSFDAAGIIFADHFPHITVNIGIFQSITVRQRICFQALDDTVIPAIFLYQLCDLIYDIIVRFKKHTQGQKSQTVIIRISIQTVTDRSDQIREFAFQLIDRIPSRIFSDQQTCPDRKQLSFRWYCKRCSLYLIFQAGYSRLYPSYP